MKHAWTNFGAALERSPFRLRDPQPIGETPEGAIAYHHSRQSRQIPEQRNDAIGNIRTAALSFQNMHMFGDLLLNYLKARKSVFIDRLNWHICEADGMEFDQYDTPFCKWVVLVEFGEIVGGVRLLPTTATCGIYSYMLRDAHLGLLDDFPTDVLFIHPPVESQAWEASRFFIKDSIPGARRLMIQSLLFTEMSRIAEENGARYILGIVPAIWARWARRLNVTATPIGAPFTIDGSRSQSVLFQVGSLNRSEKAVTSSLSGSRS
ncbi:acyl-homoserine-lactone synthase [Roseovarius sp.]|uniref:acyl-homoserine-lactone synthase n=1 Tax=Roseovarius sp. TaxID=1486281 RepID=UPI003A96D17F